MSDADSSAGTSSSSSKKSTSLTYRDAGVDIDAGNELVNRIGPIAKATHRPELEIFDRVGGGDSFASGLIYGFLTYNDPAKAVEYGAAHGAHAMTTPGDTSMATLPEIEKLVGGGSARVDR